MYIEFENVLINVDVDSVVLEPELGCCLISINGKTIQIDDPDVYKNLVNFIKLHATVINYNLIKDKQENINKIHEFATAKYGEADIVRSITDADKFIADVNKKQQQYEEALDETRQMNFQFGMKTINEVN